MNTQHQTIKKLINNHRFLTDGGMETVLIFKQGIDLPYFASFDLLSRKDGQQIIEHYMDEYMQLAARYETGFILETPTWRAHKDWGEKLGYSEQALIDINKESVELMKTIRNRYPAVTPVLISGNIGPRGDGYQPTLRMSSDEARRYHQPQISTLCDAGVDMVSAFTLNYIDEAVGITLAARAAKVPVVISFTLETDGLLPSGESLAEAIRTVDQQSDHYPLYYMINCAHPSHFETMLAGGGDWLRRIVGIRGNASRCSHEELDSAEVLDDGNPLEFGEDYKKLQNLLPDLRVYGGCCGTDFRHVSSVAAACLQ